ncbi:MAG: DNA mismatch repair endonuclease MutL [Planctomycetota bacterium]|nr:DNA mismatch repair endonuclease MutL [Planctomycetota bacterium]
MIERLPVEVVNQIAAGEVIERPFSVVKELVENALDAGARRLRVEIEGGGSDLIRITDDGEGFLPEDLPLAFASHSTSKLRSVHDLDHIASLGFRGEALASIGSVARCSIKTRRHDREEAYLIRCDGGKQNDAVPAGGPPGTQIEVRDLFFNTPARRRFLKSPGAEKARIQELLCELSLARLEVDFTLVHEGKEVLRLPGGEDLARRFASCFGRSLQKGLLPVRREYEGIKVEGLVAEPDLARRDGKLELLYINGRRASERSATFSVRQAFREFLMRGRFPVYVLHMSMNPELVDVNVHPRKAEVRFVHSRRVAGTLHEAVRQALQERGVSAAQTDGGIQVRDLPRARSGFPDLPQDLFARPASEGSTAAPFGKGPEPAPAPIVRVSDAGGGSAPQAASAAPVEQPNPFRGVSGRFLQVHDLYILLAVDDGLMVVDQHALHERVVYERLRAEHRRREVQVQRLLTPVAVSLSPTEKAWVLEAAEVLRAGGLEVDDFGPDAVAVHTLPAVLQAADPERLLRSILPVDGDQDAAESLEEQLVERFHSMACRRAVMSGDRMSEAEIAAMLEEAATLEHPHNCPHGRPTVLTFGSAELERYFRRRC